MQPDATTVVLAANPSNTPPDPDRYFLVDVTATSTGAGTGTFDLQGVTARGSANVMYTYDYSGCGTLPEPDLAASPVSLRSGESIVGNVCWSIIDSDEWSLAMSVPSRGRPDLVRPALTTDECPAEDLEADTMGLSLCAALRSAVYASPP